METEESRMCARPMPFLLGDENFTYPSPSSRPRGLPLILQMSRELPAATNLVNKAA